MRIIIMSLKCFVKVGSVNNLSDARYFSAMNVDLIGFKLDENNNDSINLESLKEIRNWISGVGIIGEFSNSNNDYINDIIKNFSFDYIQIDYPHNLEKIEFDKKKIILNINKSNKINTKKKIDDLLKNYSDIFLLNIDFENEETLTLYNKLFENNFKVLNGFNLSIPFIKVMIKKKSFYGISIKGNNEIRPGYKDYSSFSNLLEFLNEAN